ncbi:MAG: vWA domain-containing protein [Roseibacillus sp.]
MILTNPWGLLALLGIPAVLLIHFLQRQAQVIPVSTLFLLEQTQRESTSGRRFDRLTNSIPLWLQLLMVLLLTWLLAEPRYKSKTSTQQVAIVIDSSASMSVFRDELKTTLETELPNLKGPASKLQIYLLTSDPDEPILYSGDDQKEALAAIAEWSPTAGAMDPNAALRLARSRIRSEGLLIYLTDNLERTELPFDAQLLAIGKPTDNLGFTGLSFSEDGKSWQATVRNYSDTQAERGWQVLFPDGSLSEKRELVLSADGISTITGTFPTGADYLTVKLDSDSLALDDHLPIINPQPKTLNTLSELPPKFNDFEKRFLSFFPNLETKTSSTPDLTLSSYDPLLPIIPETHSIITINETARSRKFLSGGIVSEPHPLTQGLNWQALQSRETIPFPVTSSDKVLLWQGQRPLIVLREVLAIEGETSSSPKEHLIFNFDLSLSNALKLPSTVILLHRFTSGLREQKIAFEAINTETNQELDLAHDPSQQLIIKQLAAEGAFLTREMPLNEILHTPSQPGYFEVFQGETLLLKSASHFADTREADLRKAATQNELTRLTASAVDQNTNEDKWWPVWVLLTITALLAAWHFTKTKANEEDTKEATSIGPSSHPTG